MLSAAALLQGISGCAATPPDGGVRGHGYANAEAAFADVFLTSGLGLRAYRENREYAAAIYEMPDGSWHSTVPAAGGRMTSTIAYHLVPREALQIVGAHTHGQPIVPEDQGNTYGASFSSSDLRNASHNYRISRGKIAKQFLLTSELRILRLSLSGIGPGNESGLVSSRTEVLGELSPRTGTFSIAVTPEPLGPDIAGSLFAKLGP